MYNYVDFFNTAGEIYSYAYDLIHVYDLIYT